MLKWAITLIISLITGLGITSIWYIHFIKPKPEVTTIAEINLDLETAKPLFYARACTNCHDVDRTIVGPSFNAIALRYANMSDIEATLLTSLRQGSHGKWTETYSMPIQPPNLLSDAEAKLMLKWILSQDTKN